VPKHKDPKTSSIDPGIAELYNVLMYDIEPELCTWSLPTLEARYKKETDAEYRKRMERYAKAIEIFGKKFGAAMAIWKDELAALQRDAAEILQAQGQAGEKLVIEKLEDDFQHDQ
jgi:hypothetical protein